MKTSPQVIEHLVHKAKRTVRLLVLAMLVPCGFAHAQFEMEKIGDPIWEPRGYSLSSFEIPQHTGFSSIQNQRRFVSEMLGDAYVARENYELGGFQAEPIEGPYDLVFPHAVAAAGGIDTDVFLLQEARDPGTILMLTTLIPSENAPTGPSVDGLNSPIFPDEIFPMEYNLASIKLDGIEQLPDDCICIAEIPALSDYGIVTDEYGEEHDLTGLHWTHDFTTFGYTQKRNVSVSDILGDYRIVDEYRDAQGHGWNVTYSYSVVRRDTDLAGDLSYNEELDMHDLNILSRNVGFDAINLRLDMNGDEAVDVADVHYWVTDLKNTWIGDANLDGEFNSSDFVQVFSAGKYETNAAASWSEGDWNADARFDSGDFVMAFADGGYENGPRAVVAAVPEPTSRLLVLIVLAALPFFRKRLS